MPLRWGEQRSSSGGGIPALVFALACLFCAIIGTAASNFDFRAFYCAGTVVQQRGNPYDAEPLHSCERALPNDPFRPYSRVTALPAPLPGYAIALFIPFARLPFPVAAHLWTVLLLGAVAVAVASTALLSGLPVALVCSAFLLSLCAGSVGLGESVPLCVASVSVAALFAQKGRWGAASLAAAGTLIEPHLGLPVIISLAVWAPKARVPLLAIAAILSSISLLTLGLKANLEYFAGVLPAHALSELGSDAQLSLSVVLHALGADPRTAIAVGTASYLLATAVGVVSGKMLAQRLGSNAFLVAAPAAFALIGGTFIHVTQMAVALPLTLLLLARAPQHRTFFAIACLLLAVPWRVVGSPLLMTAAVIIVFYVSWELWDRSLRIAVVSAGAAILLLISVNMLMTAPPMEKHSHIQYAELIDRKYAEASWARYNEEYLSTGAPERWWRRVPTWVGLLVLGGGAIRTAGIRTAYESVPVRV